MAGDRGLIRLIVLVIIGILLLGYFDISIRAIISSPVAQDNLTYLGKLVWYLWENILEPFVGYLYVIVTE